MQNLPCHLKTFAPFFPVNYRKHLKGFKEGELLELSWLLKITVTLVPLGERVRGSEIRAGETGGYLQVWTKGDANNSAIKGERRGGKKSQKRQGQGLVNGSERQKDLRWERIKMAFICVCFLT